jgi:hypothetical protein
MKPRKKWEPVYRFGGGPADYWRPAPLGTTNRIVVKTPKPKRKKK